MVTLMAQINKAEKDLVEVGQAIIEAEEEKDISTLSIAFPSARAIDGQRIAFLESEHPAHSVLGFISERRIPILRMERTEPSLEDLFVEVTEK